VKNVNKSIETIQIGDVIIEVKNSISLEEYNSVCSALAVSPFVETEEGFTCYVPSGEVMAFQV
jgi:hypothetical protein